MKHQEGKMDSEALENNLFNIKNLKALNNIRFFELAKDYFISLLLEKQTLTNKPTNFKYKYALTIIPNNKIEEFLNTKNIEYSLKFVILNMLKEVKKRCSEIERTFYSLEMELFDTEEGLGLKIIAYYPQSDNFPELPLGA